MVRMIWETTNCFLQQQRIEVDAVGIEVDSSFASPIDHRFDQIAVGASQIQKVAIAIDRVQEG